MNRTRATAAFVALFVAVQLLLPTAMYVSRLTGHPRPQHRLSWQMFSTNRAVYSNFVAHHADGSTSPVDATEVLGPIRGRMTYREGTMGALCRAIPTAERITNPVAARGEVEHRC